jgi:hypothetical protein
MENNGALRFLALSAFALLFHSATATADCSKPAWKDPQAFKNLDRAASTTYVFEYQARVHEFIACQRNTLQKRASGLAPSEVRQLVLRDREIEDLAFAEVIELDSCLGFARRESDPAVARKKCEDFIKWALEDRLPNEYPADAEMRSEQRNEFGGILSFRTLYLGQPGQCYDAPCDNMYAVEVTNTTAVALKCEVVLTVSNRQDGTHRGVHATTLYPGDSLPVARVRIRRSPDDIEQQVTCARVLPSLPGSGVPGACVLHWSPRAFEYPKNFSRSEWQSGAAWVEFATQQGHRPAEAYSVVQEDASPLGEVARRLIEKVSFSTNCAGQRFRLRVEFRAFPCYACTFESGVVTVLGEDRVLN